MTSRLPQYRHDGSETPEDQFVVRGVADGKESVPAVVRVLVAPVNDEPPHIANNTGLVLWEGSSAIITSTHLGESHHHFLWVRNFSSYINWEQTAEETFGPKKRGSIRNLEKTAE